jgi:protein-S-isoprenylcysteine O-methyltransferase Ste14
MKKERPRKIVPPFWMLACMGLAWLFHRYLPVAPLPIPHASLLGRGVAVLGLLCALWPLAQFLAARTGVVPFSEARVLVTGGLYRVTRNPMYLGLAFVLMGFGLMLGSVGALLPVPLFPWIIQKRFIEGEERFLEAAFGDEYLDYRRRVRRWL